LSSALNLVIAGSSAKKNIKIINMREGDGKKEEKIALFCRAEINITHALSLTAHYVQCKCWGCGEVDIERKKKRSPWEFIQCV